MNLLNINSIAEAISLRLGKDNMENIADDMVINLVTDEDSFDKIDEECFKLTNTNNEFQRNMADVIEIKIGDINFKINKKKAS